MVNELQGEEIVKGTKSAAAHYDAYKAHISQLGEKPFSLATFRARVFRQCESRIVQPNRARYFFFRPGDYVNIHKGDPVEPLPKGALEGKVENGESAFSKYIKYRERYGGKPLSRSAFFSRLNERFGMQSTIYPAITAKEYVDFETSTNQRIDLKFNSVEALLGHIQEKLAQKVEEPKVKESIRGMALKNLGFFITTPNRLGRREIDAVGLALKVSEDLGRTISPKQVALALKQGGRLSRVIGKYQFKQSQSVRTPEEIGTLLRNYSRLLDNIIGGRSFSIIVGGRNSAVLKRISLADTRLHGNIDWEDLRDLVHSAALNVFAHSKADGFGPAIGSEVIAQLKKAQNINRKTADLDKPIALKGLRGVKTLAEIMAASKTKSLDLEKEAGILWGLPRVNHTHLAFFMLSRMGLQQSEIARRYGLENRQTVNAALGYLQGQISKSKRVGERYRKLLRSYAKQ
jgi:hypothetical protein